MMISNSELSLNELFWSNQQIWVLVLYVSIYRLCIPINPTEVLPLENKLLLIHHSNQAQALLCYFRSFSIYVCTVLSMRRSLYLVKWHDQSLSKLADLNKRVNLDQDTSPKIDSQWLYVFRLNVPWIGLYAELNITISRRARILIPLAYPFTFRSFNWRRTIRVTI